MPNTVATDNAHWTGTPSVEDLEQRVQRLEDVVAAVCDTQTLEERVYARVTEQLAKRGAVEAPRDSRQEPLPPAEHGSEHEQPDLRAAVAHGLLTSMTPPEAMTLVGEMWSDIRTFWRMLRDHNYKMTWMGKLVGLVPLVFILWTMFVGFRTGIPLIDYPLSLLCFVPFLFIAFKAWGRELRRYREFTAYRRR